MKSLSALLLWIFLTLLLSWLSNWVFGFASSFLIVPVFRLPLRRSVLLGFCAGLLSWMGSALFIDYTNQGQLSQMISSLLQVKSPSLMIGVTGILGGLGTAIAAWVAASVLNSSSSEKVVL